jgi:hypothetical protein
MRRFPTRERIRVRRRETAECKANARRLAGRRETCTEGFSAPSDLKPVPLEGEGEGGKHNLRHPEEKARSRVMHSNLPQIFHAPDYPLEREGGKCENIFCTPLSRFLVFFSGLPDRVSLADPRQIKFLDPHRTCRLPVFPPYSLRLW